MMLVKVKGAQEPVVQLESMPSLCYRAWLSRERYT